MGLREGLWEEGAGSWQLSCSWRGGHSRGALMRGCCRALWKGLPQALGERKAFSFSFTASSHPVFPISGPWWAGTQQVHAAGGGVSWACQATTAPCPLCLQLSTPASLQSLPY